GPGRGAGLRALTDRAGEAGELQVEGLHGLYARRDDVAGAIGEPVLAERLRRPHGDPGVEDADGFVAGVVVDDHLSRPDHGRPPELAGRQPRELDVGDHARGVLEVDEGDVGAPRADAVARERGDAGRERSEPVAEDGEVVWAEVPDAARGRPV